MPPRAKHRIIDDPVRMAQPLMRIFLRRLAEILAKLPEASAEPAFQRRARVLASLPPRTKPLRPDEREAVALAERAFAASLLRARRRVGE